MPLLKKRPFKKVPLPQGLRNDEEVFHCTMTNEIFRSYEDYCQRVILCNSMIWSCSITGKTGLTYSEAVESEENAKLLIKDFPTELRIPILFLASKTQKTSFLDMVDDIFMYVKDRYFIGETLEASFTGNKWRESHVIQVLAPNKHQIKSAFKNGQHNCLPAALYKYEVEQLDSEEADITEIMIVDHEHIKRKKGTFTRDKCKLFLKQFLEMNDQGIIVLKDSVLESYGINKMKFEQIFDGPLPKFNVPNKLKTTVNGKKVKQETLTQFLDKSNGVLPTNNGANLLDKMKKRQEEYQQMKQKVIEERLAEKQKRKEENLKLSLLYKEWCKPKEDLELEDHQILPVPACLTSKLPDQYIGDVLAVIEFVHSFSRILYSKDFFPDGLTLELMERALVQKEITGPLSDLIQMFLSTLFHVQNEEASQYSVQIDNSTDINGIDINDNISLTNATHFATVASHWSLAHQGLPLNKLPLYALTITEVLRLHLLSSGARINDTGAKWRYQNRGGYTSEDDPGLYLRLNQPKILKALALYNITELPIGDKLAIIHCLMNQLLTFADVRDVVEERLEKSKQAKLDLKLLQISERRREQEVVAMKFKTKKEAKQNKTDASTELDKIELDAEKKRVTNEKKYEELAKQTLQHQVYLGQDRGFRMYYKLESIPAFLINSEEENRGSCYDECAKYNPNLIGADRNQTLVYIGKILKQSNIKNTDKEFNHESIDLNCAIKEDLDNVSDPEALLVCSGNPSNCIVHSTSLDRPKWGFFHNREQISSLISGLNIRGIRESELKQMIITDQESLNSLLHATPATQLNPCISETDVDQKLRPKRQVGKPRYEDTNLGYPIEMDTEAVLQLALVDNILELEEKLFAGNLGIIKVKDRDVWRENLINRRFENLDNTLLLKKDDQKDKLKKDNRNAPDPGNFLGSTMTLEPKDSNLETNDFTLNHTENHKLAIQTLAITLIQIGQGVQDRYLKKPLGHANMRAAKKAEEHDKLSKWEESLMGATSYSQIFLHYTTLDNCIMWSRSALLARCQICRRQTDSENMLLCDSCNKGHHLYCLKPKLKCVPIGDWFCKECEKQRQKELQLQNPEPKPVRKRRLFKAEISDDENCEQEDSIKLEPRKKRKVFKLESSSDDEASEKSEDVRSELQEIVNGHHDSEISEESEQVEVCTKCGMDGTLLCCDNCPSVYHLECADPPLRRVPRGQWFCHKCKLKIKSKENADSDESTEECGYNRRSKRRDLENRDDLPLHNAPLQELLSDILKQENAWPFIRPVQKNEVPDYYDIISRPMDFGTIKYKLNMGNYSCDAELMTDAALVFQNCNVYNSSNDEVYKCGAKLLSHFKNKCHQLGLKLTGAFEELTNEIKNNKNLDDEDYPNVKRLCTE